ncbi:GNAT family N-acetyltransferase [Rhodococcus sp. NPDC127530]|uniref:GNAT family N-acetyltransferase n=1 Tax=unclassified Rhodococcus (in: high G+C Gram-positive bacteria) TaxID=192944 RepID=UPI003639BCE1
MAQRLSPGGREFLRRNFVPVAVETYTGTTPEFWNDWLSDAKLDDLHGLVVVLDSNGTPAAWVASNQRQFGGRDCLYANSAGVHPDYQGSGLSSAIWRELLRSAIVESAPRRLYAVMRTANPLVYGAWSAGAGGPGKAFPSPTSSVIPHRVLRIATDTAGYLGQLDRLDPATLIIKNAYEHTKNGLWAERPTSHQDSVDDWMRATLGPKDAIVLVVTFDPIPMLLNEIVRTVRIRLGIGTVGSSRSSCNAHNA